MDFDDAIEDGSCAFWVIGWLGGAAALHWAWGWSWWWAVPVPLVPAFFVSLALCGLIALGCSLADWARGPPGYAAPPNDDDLSEPDEKPEPAGRPGAGATQADYARLKQAMAKRFHPDACAAASPVERAVREAVFKEIWAEVDRIEGRRGGYG